jgi:hypothetical protein
MRLQQVAQFLPQLHRLRIIVLRGLDIGQPIGEADVFPFQLERLADAATGVKQEAQESSHLGIDMVGGADDRECIRWQQEQVRAVPL